MAAELGRPVSEVEVEQEVHRIIALTAKTASYGHFGSHTQEDAYQQAYYEALKVLQLDKYDDRKPLANFLYVHMRNRLSNLRRKEVFRSEAPCKCCDAFNPGDNPCEKWQGWNRRNQRKLKLAGVAAESPSPIVAPHVDTSQGLILGELTSYIEQRLPAELLDDYRIFAAAGKLPTTVRVRVRNALRAILAGSPWDESKVVGPNVDDIIQGLNERTRVEVVKIVKKRAKLSRSDVLEIRALRGQPQKILAKQFGCSVPTISQVQLRRRHKKMV